MNPICFRIWYPRIVADEDFSELLAQLRDMRAEKVYLFDNSYMDNFQLSDQLLSERIPLLRRRVAEFAEHKIVAGINSGATIGHGGIRGFADTWFERRDIEWWVDADGTPAIGIACPIGHRFLKFVDHYFEQLASTGAREIFIDDDMRPSNHSPVLSELGCVCEEHVDRFCAEQRVGLSRDQLVARLHEGWIDHPSPLQVAWHQFVGKTFIEMGRRIRAAVDRVDPAIRLGLMPVQNFILPFGAEYFSQLLSVVSGPHRPLLRTHNFHGLPRRVHPGSAIYARLNTPPHTEHVVEIENAGHNFHDFSRGPRQTRYAILTALATGMGGASINLLGDQPPLMDWERHALSDFVANDEFYRTISRLVHPEAVMRGVPIRNPAFNRHVPALDHSKEIPSAYLWNHRTAPECLLAPLGIAYEFSEDAPALLTGRTPSVLGRETVERLLHRGAVIDADAAMQIIRMGLGNLLGVRVGEPMSSYSGQRFVHPDFCGKYAGQVVPLRRIYRIHRLECDPAVYRPATEIIHAYPERVQGPGVLVRNDEQRRLCIVPYPLLSRLETDGTESGIVACRHHRYLLVRLFEWVLRAKLPVWVDGPPHIAPYYFDQPDGTVVVSVFNPDPDWQYGFDIVLGRLRPHRTMVHRVTSDGRLLRAAGMVIQDDRLRIDREHALPPCDVTVFVFKARSRNEYRTNLD